MAIHYAEVDRANESDNQDYWSNTLCGMEYAENMEDKIEYVTCKKCLKRWEKNKTQIPVPNNWDGI